MIGTKLGPSTSKKILLNINRSFFLVPELLLFVSFWRIVNKFNKFELILSSNKFFHHNFPFMLVVPQLALSC